MKFRRIIVFVLAIMIAMTSVPAFEIRAHAAYDMPYYIEVDVSSQIVTIYRTEDKSIARQMLCSTGYRNKTPLGTFTMPKNRRTSERQEWYFFYGNEKWAKYASRIVDNFLFHSIPYTDKKDSAINKYDASFFGQPASLGCVRLRWQDSKFIAENCLAGTKVKIYKSGKENEGLRELLKQASYTGQNGMTYEEYMGMPQNEGDLGRFSTGIEVKNLQCRLQALGLYSGDADGKYYSSTVNAVKNLQKMLGLSETGIASPELQALIYSDDAPTSMNVSLSEGMNGPVVKNLQENLATLRLYEGDIDGVYDVDVTEAVKRFQKAYTYTVNGVASSKVQKAVYYEAGKLEAVFSMNEDYTLEVIEDQMYLGVIDAETGIRIREKASTDSKALGRVTDGDIVFALKPGDYWSKIQFGDCVGYIMNKYADYRKQELVVLKYTATDDDRIHTIGFTSQEYFDGASLPSELFEKYLAAEGSLENYEGLVNYVTVNTEEGVSLNLRQTPSTTAEVLAELPSGTHAKVILRSTEWTMVTVDGQNGYLMNNYLEFWSGPEDALEGADADETESEPEIEEIFAVTTPSNGKKASVYDMDSDDAKVLGSLGKDIEVKIVRSTDGWCLIEYEGHQGYMKDEDLSFNSEYAFEKA